jgi:hypothetical protein
VAGAPDPAVFIREFLSGFFESWLVNGLISTDEYHDHLAGLSRVFGNWNRLPS